MGNMEKNESCNSMNCLYLNPLNSLIYNSLLTPIIIEIDRCQDPMMSTEGFTKEQNNNAVCVLD